MLPIIKSFSHYSNSQRASNNPEKKNSSLKKTNLNLKTTHLKLKESNGNYKHGMSNLISYEGPSSSKSVAVRKANPNPKPFRKIKSFNPRFETYYYRDLLWKVNFSNEMIVEPPLEYEHRLRVFIGKGNNSGLIHGLIKRRIWFAVTDRIEDANFVWTQIKYLPFFEAQNCFEAPPISSRNQGSEDPLDGGDS
jgi:hypothetical protein